MKEEDRAVDEDNVGDSTFAMRTGRDCPPGDWRWGLRDGGGQSRHVNGPSRGPGKVQSYALTRSLEDPWAEPLTVPLPLKARCASLLPEPGGKATRSVWVSQRSSPRFAAEERGQDGKEGRRDQTWM